MVTRRGAVLFALALMVSGACPLLLHAQSVEVIQTNADRSLLLSRQPSLSFGELEKGGTLITVDPSTSCQQMDGFGGSLTDSSAWLLEKKLGAKPRHAVLEHLFNPRTGIGLSFLRQPMGASDFSAQGNFSYDSMPPGKSDVGLAHFSIARDLKYTIPAIRQALAINPQIKVMLLPWSPPAWMKLSGSMDGGSFNDEYFAPLAEYFVRTIKAYEAHGIRVYAVAAQNEPENADSHYPTELLSAAEEAKFIGGYLGPALQKDGLGAVKIFGYEHNWGDTAYPLTLLKDPHAAAYLAGISWHCYSGPGPQAQSVVHDAYPDKSAWFTECTSRADGPFATDLGWDMSHLIIGSTRHWARAVLEWNLVLDEDSGPYSGDFSDARALVTVDTSKHPAHITYNVGYYAYGHISKFVQPGAFRIKSNSATPGTGGIENVAFRNPDGSIVLVTYNAGSAAANFQVVYAPTTRKFGYTLPGGAVATFVWLGADVSPGTQGDGGAPPKSR